MGYKRDVSSVNAEWVRKRENTVKGKTCFTRFCEIDEEEAPPKLILMDLDLTDMEFK